MKISSNFIKNSIMVKHFYLEKCSDCNFPHMDKVSDGDYIMAYAIDEDDNDEDDIIFRLVFDGWKIISKNDFFISSEINQGYKDTGLGWNHPVLKDKLDSKKTILYKKTISIINKKEV